MGIHHPVQVCAGAGSSVSTCPPWLCVLLCLQLLVPLYGCMDDPYAPLCTTEKPQASRVVGRYTLKEQTITSGGVSALQGRLCVVDLAADGTFTATNIPPLITEGPPIRSLKSLVSGSGTWRLDQVGSVDNGSGQFKTHWGVRLDSPTARLQAPGLMGNQPPYGLIFSIGDPDTLTVMVFEQGK